MVLVVFPSESVAFLDKDEAQQKKGGVGLVLAVIVLAILLILSLLLR